MMFRFLRESSQTRNRTYRRAPTKRALKIRIVGRRFPAEVEGGGAVEDLTTSLRSEVSSCEPARFVALTLTRSVEPTSTVRTPYDLPFAPSTSMQLRPAAVHRCHW